MFFLFPSLLTPCKFENKTDFILTNSQRFEKCEYWKKNPKSKITNPKSKEV